MEDKDLNKGALFNTLDTRIFKGGDININGDKQKFLIAESKTQEGKKVYPLYHQVGWVNINTKKNEENQPDILGNFDYNTFAFKLAGWKKESQKGTKYLSVAIQFDKKESEKNDGFNETEKKIEENKSEFDDEVPF